MFLDLNLKGKLLRANCDKNFVRAGTEEESSDRDTLSDVDENDQDDLDSDIGGPGGGDRKSVWAITREQLNYYTTQFFNMQPNPAGIIPGALAKEFFERSK